MGDDIIWRRLSRFIQEQQLTRIFLRPSVLPPSLLPLFHCLPPSSIALEEGEIFGITNFMGRKERLFISRGGQERRRGSERFWLEEGGRTERMDSVRLSE